MHTLIWQEVRIYSTFVLASFSPSCIRRFNLISIQLGLLFRFVVLLRILFIGGAWPINFNLENWCNNYG
jgi:hypothetical protein